MPLALLATLCLLVCLGVMTASQLAVDRGGALRRWLRLIASTTLRGGVARSLLVLALVPGIALTILLASKQLTDREEHEIALVTEAAESAAIQVEAFLARHTAGIRSAAEAIELDARPSSDRSGQWLLRYHPIYPDFLTMLVADASGQVISASRQEHGQPVIAAFRKHDISDRHYFSNPMTDGRDYVSQAFRGRGLGTDPLIAISSRIDIDGRSYGIVQGSLNLKAFQRLDASYQRLLNARVILADASGSVIYADPATGYEFLESIADAPLGMGQDSAKPTSIADRNSDRTLRVGHKKTPRGWSVSILRPVPTLAETLADVWWVAFAWLGVCALFAVALAVALARRVGVPMQRLVSTLDRYRVDQPSPFRSVAGLPQEYRTIFRHLHRFVVRLAIRHGNLGRALDHAEALQNELRSVLELRDMEIQQRTRELAMANQELEVLSRTDPLTQLFNRRWFETEYERMWRAAVRASEPISVILLDVDFFKRYNDSYGHLAGDEVLKQVARALQECLRRPDDIAVRFGGEEFVVVLGNTGTGGALEMAERLRAAVAALSVEHRHSPLGYVSVTIGLCSTHPGPGEDRDSILRLADTMLYEAKALGRNRIATSELADRSRAPSYAAE